MNWFKEKWGKSLKTALQSIKFMSTLRFFTAEMCWLCLNRNESHDFVDFIQMKVFQGTPHPVFVICFYLRIQSRVNISLKGKGV